MNPSTNLVEQLNRMLSAEALAVLADRDLLDRFARTRDEAAFAALLHRHGALVRSVCRRIVTDVHLADDVFQATFVILSRKAGSLRKKHLLGNWLFGVAQRLARQAQQQRCRRLQRERHAASQRSEIVQNQHPWDELFQILHEELYRLPERLRAPLLACYLEGKTQDEAARSLGWNVKMVRRRLDQGRELLRVRMTGRGATLSAGLFASILAPSAVSAAFSRELDQSLFVSTMANVNGGTISSSVAGIVAGGLRMIALTKIKTGFITVLAVCGLALSMGAIWQSTTANEPPAGNTDAANTAAAAADAKDDFFGDPLPAGAVVRLGSLRLRHGDTRQPPELIFNADGKSLYSSGGNSIRQWNAEDGREIKHLLTKRASDRLPQEESLLPGDSLWYSAFSADGNTAVIATTQNSPKKPAVIEVSVWDLASFKKRCSFPLQKPDGTDFNGLGQHLLVLSPDASKLAFIEVSSDVWIWDLKKEQPTARAIKQPQCSAILFNPARQQAIITDTQWRTTIWDMNFEKEIAAFGGFQSAGFAFFGAAGRENPGQPYQIAPLAVSPDGKYLAVSYFLTGGFVGGLQRFGNQPTFLVGIYEMCQLEKLRQAPMGAANPELKPYREWGFDNAYNLTIRFSPDSKSVIAISGELLESRVWHWNLDQKEPVKWPKPIGKIPGMISFAISRDVRTLATCENDLRIRLWDMVTGKEKPLPEGHYGEVTTFALLPDGKTIRTASDDGTVRDWALATGKQLNQFSDQKEPVSHPVLSPDGKRVLTWHRQQTAPGNGQGGGRKGPAGGLGGGLGGNVSPPPRELKGHILIRDAKTGEIQHNLGNKPIKSVAVFAPDGTTFVTADDWTKPLECWNLESGKKTDSIGWPGGTPEWKGIYQTADGKQFIILEVAKSLTAIQLASKFVAQWRLDKDVFEERLGQQISDSLISVAVAPDGKTVALGVLSGIDASGRLVLCELETGKKIKEFQLNGEIPQQMTFSPDGKTLAVSDFNVMLFDVAAGKRKRTLTGHRGSITQLAYSKDGKCLASASSDSTVLIWETGAND